MDDMIQLIYLEKLYNNKVLTHEEYHSAMYSYMSDMSHNDIVKNIYIIIVTVYILDILDIVVNYKI